MPSPVYIICSESGSEDSQTGLVSLYHVIERLLITPTPAPQEGKRPTILRLQQFRITASWMLNQGDDPSAEYEFEMNVAVPPDANRQQLMAGRFHFEGGKPFYRISVLFDGPPPIAAGGVMIAESKLRKVGDESWLSQTFPVVIDLIGAPTKTDGAIP